MDFAEYILHPDRLNKETLFALREEVAQHPCFAVARLLYLHNLFLLHSPEFNDELRRSALLLPDRRAIFDIVEGRNYRLEELERTVDNEAADLPAAKRTEQLIDDFLLRTEHSDPAERRKAAADAANDYTYYLLQMDDAEPESDASEASEHRRDLVEGYLENAPAGRIKLNETPEYMPEEKAENSEGTDLDDDYFTETLAEIYIKQGRYEKAIEIIRKLNLNFPKKNTYFADQIRFLEKLIVNDKHKKQ